MTETRSSAEPRGTGRSTADRGLSPVQGVLRQLDNLVIIYLRTWKGTVLSSFVSPLFYVVAMGVLLGGFIHKPASQLEGATSYLAFIVPGLIAAQAMQMAVSETTYPVMSALKWQRTFYAQLATPLQPRDLANALLCWTVFRVGTSCGVYFLVMAPFGVFATWWGPVLAWLVTLLVGLAFGTWVFAFSAQTRSEGSFTMIYRFGLVPMFLFSGAFFPIANLGEVGSWVARCTPLWQGVDLIRMLCLDSGQASTVAVNLLVLSVLAVVGWAVALRSLHARLTT
jgi:lipooligosaccharide transport system permease protein